MRRDAARSGGGAEQLRLSRENPGPLTPADGIPTKRPAHGLSVELCTLERQPTSPFSDQRLKLSFASELNYWHAQHQAGGPLLGTDLGESVRKLSPKALGSLARGSQRNVQIPQLQQDLRAVTVFKSGLGI